MFFSAPAEIHAATRRRHLLSWLALGLIFALHVAVPLILLQGRIGYVPDVVLATWLLLHFSPFMGLVVIPLTRGYSAFTSRTITPRHEHPHPYTLLDALMPHTQLAFTPSLHLAQPGQDVLASIDTNPGYGPALIRLGHHVTSLPAPQLQAVMAHELAHEQNRDHHPLGFLNAVKHWGFWLMAVMVTLLEVNGHPVVGLTLLLWPLLVLLLHRWHSRLREYVADATAIHIIGWHNRHHLADALTTLANTLPIVNRRWLDTHPSIPQRIAALHLP